MKHAQLKCHVIPQIAGGVISEFDISALSPQRTILEIGA